MSSRCASRVALCGAALLLVCRAGEALTLDEVLRREARLGSPILAISPESAEAALRPGETKTVTFTVRNAGGQVLRWTMGPVPDWLLAEPRGGSLRFEEEQEVLIRLDAGKLLSGRTEAQIALGSPDGKAGLAGFRLSVALLPQEPTEAPALPPGPAKAERWRLSLGVAGDQHASGDFTVGACIELLRGDHALAVTVAPEQYFVRFYTAPHFVSMWEAYRLHYRRYRGDQAWFWQAGLTQFRVLTREDPGLEVQTTLLYPSAGIGWRNYYSKHRTSLYSELYFDLMLGEGTEPVWIAGDPWGLDPIEVRLTVLIFGIVF